MSPIVMIAVWALAGTVVSLALRPIVTRSLRKALPDAAPIPLGVLEGVIAILFAAFAYRFGVGIEFLVFSALVATCVPLAALDLIARRLPNVLVGASYVGVLSLLGLDAVLHGPGDLVRSLLSMTAALAVHGVLYGIGGIGGGDLKLVGVLAAALGWISWTATWTGLVAGWLTACVVVVAGRVYRSKARREVPLGLFLIIGTLVTMLLLAPR